MKNVKYLNQQKSYSIFKTNICDDSGFIKQQTTQGEILITAFNLNSVVS